MRTQSFYSNVECIYKNIDAVRQVEKSASLIVCLKVFVKIEIMKIIIYLTRDVNNVSGNQLPCLDPLDGPVVLADDLRDLRLVLLESFDGTLGIALLVHECKHNFNVSSSLVLI